MKRIRIIITILLCIISITSQARKFDTLEVKNEISLGLNDLFHLRNEYYLSYRSYHLGYKRQFNKFYYYRVNLLYDYYKADLITRNNYPYTIYRLNLQISGGLERHFNLIKNRLILNAGVEALGSYYVLGYHEMSDPLYDDCMAWRSKTLGIGGLLGLEFKISNKFSISSETSYLFGIVFRKLKCPPLGYRSNYDPKTIGYFYRLFGLHFSYHW